MSPDVPPRPGCGQVKGQMASHAMKRSRRSRGGIFSSIRTRFAPIIRFFASSGRAGCRGIYFKVNLRDIVHRFQNSRPLWPSSHPPRSAPPRSSPPLPGARAVMAISGGIAPGGDAAAGSRKTRKNRLETSSSRSPRSGPWVDIPLLGGGGTGEGARPTPGQYRVIPPPGPSCLFPAGLIMEYVP